jgi:AAA ATPase domain
VTMGNDGNGTSRLFAGRVLERRRLANGLSGSAQGQPLAVLVHGEAGVGKMRLVREVTEQYRAGVGEVLWGTGVHFGAASVPFAAVVQPLDRWAQEVDPSVRSSGLEGADELSKLLPSMGMGSPDDPSSRLLPVVDRVVQRIAKGQRAQRSGIPDFVRAAATIRKNKDVITAAIERRLSNERASYCTFCRGCDAAGGLVGLLVP